MRRVLLSRICLVFATVAFAVWPSARVRMTRIQTVEPGRLRPTPAPQNPEQLVSGSFAWNMAGTPPAAQPSPAAVETAEIWSTPHGFV